MPPATTLDSPVPTAAPSAAGALDRSLLRGIAWTGGMRWAGQALTWASTIVVARILTPRDYGIVGLATVFLGLVTMVSEFGLGAAVVTLRRLEPGQVRQINTLSAVLGFASAGLTCLIAPALSRFTGTPELTDVLRVMSVGFVFAGFRTVPDAALQKELRFRALALMEGAQTALMAVATVLLAMAGARYWTLVAGALLGGVFTTLVAIAMRPHGFAVPRPSSVRQAVTFSSQLLVSRLSWFSYSNADFLVVGKLLGERVLGAYTLAWSLASVPIGKISGMIMRVAPSFFAAVQDDPPALRRYLLGITEGIALLTFPMSLGLALVADDFVMVVLGDKWLAAVLPLQLLGVYASIRSITPLLHPLLTAVGQVNYAMRVEFLAALLLPAAFVAGTRWGVGGVAWAWILIHPIILIPLYLRVFRVIDLRPAAYLQALVPALSGCVPMAAVVAGMGWMLPPSAPRAVRLAACVLAGAATYTSIVLVFHRDRIEALRGILRR